MIYSKICKEILARGRDKTDLANNSIGCEQCAKNLIEEKEKYYNSNCNFTFIFFKKICEHNYKIFLIPYVKIKNRGLPYE
jgi:hypothetical protein